MQLVIVALEPVKYDAPVFAAVDSKAGGKAFPFGAAAVGAYALIAGLVVTGLPLLLTEHLDANKIVRLIAPPMAAQKRAMKKSSTARADRQPDKAERQRVDPKPPFPIRPEPNQAPSRSFRGPIVGALDFLAQRAELAKLARNTGNLPSLLFRADNDYIRALGLMKVVVALSPEDVEISESASIWSPATGRLRHHQPLRKGYVTRELQAPLQLLSEPVNEAADWYGVKPEKIRAFAMYDAETWDGIRGSVVSARQKAGIDQQKGNAILRYRIVGNNTIIVEVEVKS